MAPFPYFLYVFKLTIGIEFWFRDYSDPALPVESKNVSDWLKLSQAETLSRSHIFGNFGTVLGGAPDLI